MSKYLALLSSLVLSFFVTQSLAANHAIHHKMVAHHVQPVKRVVWLHTTRPIFAPVVFINSGRSVHHHYSHHHYTQTRYHHHWY